MESNHKAYRRQPGLSQHFWHIKSVKRLSDIKPDKRLTFVIRFAQNTGIRCVIIDVGNESNNRINYVLLILGS